MDEIVSNVLRWAVPFVLGGAVGALGVAWKFISAIRIGVQCLLRAEIIRMHDKYMARCYCPIYAKESLRRMYKAYHALGGNDVATQLYKEIMELPTDSPAEEGGTA